MKMFFLNVSGGWGFVFSPVPDYRHSIAPCSYRNGYILDTEFQTFKKVAENIEKCKTTHRFVIGGWLSAQVTWLRSIALGHGQIECDQTDHGKEHDQHEEIGSVTGLGDFG